MAIKYYRDFPTAPFRASQVYSILIGAAHNRQILTYGHVADLLGYKGSSALGGILGHIMYWCRDNHVPPLTVLVVNSQTGIPGEGLAFSDNFHTDREKVFNFDWYAVIPPTPEELDDAKP